MELKIESQDDDAFELEVEGEKAPPEFCLLLWATRGGRIGSRGEPIFSSLATSAGYCDNPTDCAGCPLMQEEIAKHPEGKTWWLCPDCLDDAVTSSKEKGTTYHIPGHYTEGQCQNPNCARPGYFDLEPRYSPILQLFIGNLNS